MLTTCKTDLELVIKCSPFLAILIFPKFYLSLSLLDFSLDTFLVSWSLLSLSQILYLHINPLKLFLSFKNVSADQISFIIHTKKKSSRRLFEEECFLSLYNYGTAIFNVLSSPILNFQCSCPLCSGCRTSLTLVVCNPYPTNKTRRFRSSWPWNLSITCNMQPTYPISSSFLLKCWHIFPLFQAISSPDLVYWLILVKPPFPARHPQPSLLDNSSVATIIFHFLNRK